LCTISFQKIWIRTLKLPVNTFLVNYKQQFVEILNISIGKERHIYLNIVSIFFLLASFRHSYLVSFIQLAPKRQP